MAERDEAAELEPGSGLGVTAPRPALAGPTVTWATVAQVADFVREAPATAADNRELVAATEAANAWCYRRRATAGYLDASGGPEDPTVSPGPDVTRAVVIFAGTSYRAGGAADGFASFAELSAGGFVPSGTLGQVKQLLGVNRPAVG